jgi:hypothetical protein
MDEWKEKVVKRLVVLTKQLGDVAGVVQRYIVQGHEVKDAGDEQMARREIEDDMADLLMQVKTLAFDLGYVGPKYDELVKLGETRMELRKKEYEGFGWKWI